MSWRIQRDEDNIPRRLIWIEEEVMPTTEKLAAALEEANAPQYMIEKAREGFYDDYLSPIAMNIHQLVADAREEGLTRIAERAMDGDFDATKEESDAWAKSPEGQETFRDLLEGR